MQHESSPTDILNAWAQTNFLRPQYVFLRELNSSRLLYFYRLYLGKDFHFDGHGISHQQARIQCALNALDFLRQNSLSSPLTSQSKSSVSLMFERAKQLGLHVRTEWKDSFTVVYRIGDQWISTGHGFNRSMAKQIAAEKMLMIFSKNETTKILLDKSDPQVILPPPPSKGLLKRDGNNENLQKKHVHFVANLIDKEERTSPTSSPRQKQQLIAICQRFDVHVEFHDDFNDNENSISSRFQSTVVLSKFARILGQFRGYGPSLLRAEENASSAASIHLKEIFKCS